MLKGGGDSSFVMRYLSEVEMGKWRQDHHNICDISVCQCDIRLQRVNVSQWAVEHLKSRKISKRFGLIRWRSTSWEFLPLRCEETKQIYIYEMYRAYTIARQGPSALLPFTTWLEAKCSSAIGSLTVPSALLPTETVATDDATVSKASFVGSAFGLLHFMRDMLAVVTLDFFGECDSMAAKVFGSMCRHQSVASENLERA